MRIRELINDLEAYARHYGDEAFVLIAADIGWNGTGVYDIEYTEGLVDSMQPHESLYPKCRHEIQHRYDVEEGEGRIVKAIFLSKSGYGVSLPTTDFVYDNPDFDYVEGCEVCEEQKHAEEEAQEE